MDCYLALKSNEGLAHATTWVNPENIILNKEPFTDDYILDEPIYLICAEQQINRDRK
jgi:hypothetical protein